MLWLRDLVQKSKEEQILTLSSDENLKALVETNYHDVEELNEYINVLELNERLIMLAINDIEFLSYCCMIDEKIINKIIDSDIIDYNLFVGMLKKYIENERPNGIEIICFFTEQLAIDLKESILLSLKKKYSRSLRYFPKVLLDDIEFVLNVLKFNTDILNEISEETFHNLINNYNGKEIIIKLIHEQKFDIDYYSSPNFIKNNIDFMKACMDAYNSSKYIFYLDEHLVTDELIEYALTKKFEVHSYADLKQIDELFKNLRVSTESWHWHYYDDLEQEYDNFKRTNNKYFDPQKIIDEHYYFKRYNRRNILYRNDYRNETGRLTYNKLLYKILTNQEYVKTIMRNGSLNVVEHIPPQLIDKEIADLVFFNNYKPKENYRYLVWAFDDTEYLIKNGYKWAIDYEINLTDELIVLALKNGYTQYNNGYGRLIKKLSNPILALELGKPVIFSLYEHKQEDKITKDVILKSIEINDKNCFKYLKNDKLAILKEVFGLQSESDEHFSKICSILEKRENIDISLLNFLKHKETISKKCKIDSKDIIEYFLGYNKNIEYLNKIITDGNLDKFIDIFNFLFNNYFVDYKYIRKLNIFFECAKNFADRPDFYLGLINKKLSNRELDCFYEFFDNQSNYKDIDIDNLTLIEERRYNTLVQIIENDNTNFYDLRDCLTRFIFNMNYEKISQIRNKIIDDRTLNNIISNANDEELRHKSEILLILYEFINNYINFVVTEEEEIGIQFKENLKNREDLCSLRLLFRNFEEKVRDVLEIEANSTLTNLNNYKKVNVNGLNYIDLSGLPFTMYSHVYTGSDIRELVISRGIGKKTICVAPITELSKMFFGKGITVGYTHIPKGNFVYSSNLDLHSDNHVKDNTIDINVDRMKVRQLTIRDCANFSRGNPETLLLRNNLIPSCILIRGKEPTEEEKNAAITLRDTLIDITGELDIDIPLVYIGQEKFAHHEDTKENNLSASCSDQVTEIQQLTSNFFTNKNSTSYTVIPAFENNYDIHMRIDNEDYILSENYEACLVGYKIQKLVNSIVLSVTHNKEDVNPYILQDILKPQKITSRKSDISDLYVNDDSIVTLAARKILPNTANYFHRDANITQKEIRQLMYEFIVDYLILNYDYKSSNYLFDSEFNVYGIDKKSSFIYKSISQFHFHEKVANEDDIFSLYYDIFTKNDIDDKIIADCNRIIEYIENMSDSDYLKYFSEYLNNQDEEMKKILIDNILLQKQRLNIAFKILISNIEWHKNQKRK